MNNYDCNQRCDQGCGCGCNHGAGLRPGPCVSRNCGKQKSDLRIKTEVLPVSVGTDEKGQPFAPKFGRYFNTIVQYAANGAIYFYDSEGVFTKMNDTTSLQDAIKKVEEELKAEVQNREDADTQLQENIDAEAETREEADKKLNAAIVDTANMLQTNINAEVNARESDRDNLQENINAEVNARIAADEALEKKIEDFDTAALDEEIEARKAADTELKEEIETETQAREEADVAINTRIDEIVNSPDVRYIEQSYADLDAIDKATVGDKDYARVLVDETHNGQSTFYQFNKADNSWEYVGAAGAYYTKTEVDDKLSEKQDTLYDQGVNQNIKTVNGQSILGKGEVSVPNPPFFTVGYASQDAVMNVTTAPNAVNLQLRGMMVPLGTYTWSPNYTLPIANELEAGVMASSDKVKLNSLLGITKIGANLELDANGELSASTGGDTYGLTKQGAEYANNLPMQVSTGTGTPKYTETTITQSLNRIYLDDGSSNNSTMIFKGATSTTAGVMVAADKAKLDGLANVKSVGDGLDLSEDGTLTATGGGGSGSGGATRVAHLTNPSTIGTSAGTKMWTVPTTGIYTINCALTVNGADNLDNFRAFLTYGTLNNQVMGISSNGIHRYVKSQLVVEGTRYLEAGAEIYIQFYDDTKNDTALLPQAVSDLDFSVYKLG